jgi:hypothetical protein
MIMVGVAADAAAAAAAVHDRDLVAIHTVPLISLATHTAHLNHMLGKNPQPGGVSVLQVQN